MIHSRIWRLETADYLEPGVYVSWDKIHHKCRKWDGANPIEILGMFSSRIEEYPPFPDRPPRPAFPGEIVIITEYLS